MDELPARAVVVPASDVGNGLATSIPRSEITEVLGQNETPIELVLDVTQFSDGKATDTQRIAVLWERTELERLLRVTEGEDVLLTFDRDALQKAVESQVEAHGLRETVLALAVAASAATGAAGTASAEPGAFFGSGAPVVQTGPDDRAVPRAAPIAAAELAPDDRAVARGTPVPTAEPSVAPDDRAVPRGAPVATPELAPDDRPVPRSTPTPAPTSVPVASPDDRAFPRSTPTEAPIVGTASDPGISWAPNPAETAVIAGAIALAITGAFFVVGVGRRRMRPGSA
jgi:hypothetical protein